MDCDETQLERWRAAIGTNAEYYLARFNGMEQAGGWAPGWNMAAFLHSTGWFCYRRMFGWALLNLAAPYGLLFAFGSAAYVLAPRANLDFPLLILAAAYLLAVFVLVPMFEDLIYYRRLRTHLADVRSAPRPPSAWTAVGGIALGAVWLAVVLAMLVMNAAYGDYSMRAKLSEAVLAASGTRAGLTEFYDKERRLPGPEEAGRFRADRPSTWVESVVYQAAEKRIVVTLREIQPGKRFALYADERGGTLAWTCRTIDVEKKHLPAACRN